MSAVFKKLNLKDQAEIVVLDAPSSFESELKTLTGVTIRRKLSEVKSTGFVLAFGTRQKQVEAFARAIATKTAGGPVSVRRALSRCGRWPSTRTGPHCVFGGSSTSRR